MGISVAEVPPPGPAIDAPEDLAAAERFLSKAGA